MTYRRTKPYTAMGISRVPCARCGKPSAFSWQVCADGNTWRGCCAKCDVDLNALVLKFFKNLPGAAEKMRKYRKETL